MKKLIYCALALATGLFAASCQQENLEPVQGGNTVTFEVSIPEVATKGLGDNVSNINDLVYAVYSTTATTLEDVQNGSAGYELLYQKNYATDVNPFNGGNTAIIPIELVNDKNYFVIFWAQNEDRWVGESFDLRSVAYPAEGMNANDNDYAAFSGISFITSDNLSAKKSVILKRPFAQINIGTQLATEFTITPTTSSVTVNKAGTSFNLIKQVAEGEGSVTFKTANVPTNPDRTEDGKLVVNNTAYTYAAMNYVFANGNVDVEYTINTAAHGAVSNTVANVPVAANYRTNIVGRLLTSTADYTVVLDEFDTNNNSGDIEVITEGLVKNQNGDYEVSNENGLAHAINTLFGEDGDFYLTSALYDMTDYDVTPPSVPNGVKLNIYGETPVVTRSATTSIAGIRIEGLDSIIKTIADGANVSISGVELVDEGSVLVETNNGTLVVSESTGAEAIVSNGDDPVEADNVKDLKTLKTALASGIKIIKLAGNITSDNILVINRALTIDGAEFTLTSTADRAINVSGADGVVIRDLTINASGERAINVIQNANNITIDNVTATAANYTVNIAASASNVNLTINNSELTGLNTINVGGAGAVIDVNGTKIICNDKNDSENYAAISINKDGVGSVVTVNGGEIVVMGASDAGSVGAVDAEIILNNVTGATQDGVVYDFYAIEYGDYYYGFSTLADAVSKAKSGETIKVIRDAVETEGVTVNKDITLDLNGKTITGVDDATVSYGLITNIANLTVKGPGAMKLTATNDRDWNAYSSVISNTVGGNLTVEGGAVLEHLGGTDMAYGIDNLTNGKGTSAITTVNDATIKSTYRAIRQFLNGVEATNELYVNAEAVIEGANKSIWMQDPSTNANTGKLVVKEGAKLYGDVYLFVCAGSESWPVSASIPASTLMDGSEVMTGNVPEGYTVENIGGVWKIIAWTSVSTADELVAALQNGATHINVAAGEYKFPKGSDVDLRGKELTIVGSENVVFDVTGIDTRDQFVTGATLKFEGVTLNFGKVNYMGFANTASLTYKNCNINGLQFLFGPEVVFEECSLNSNGAEHSVWTYGAKNVTFTDCDFTYGDRCVNCYSDNDIEGGKQTVNFTDCTFATSNTASEGAVEINSCFFSVGIEVNMDGCTAPAYGQMAYVSPWDSTNGAKTTINIK